MTAPSQTIAADLDELNDSVRHYGSFDGKEILITGGGGFIGSWLCDVLIAQGATVVCLDDMSTGVMENISQLIDEPRFKFVTHDIVEKPSDGLACDMIFHLASHPSPEEYQAHPVETIKGNSMGTLNMLDVARRTDAIFLYASTSEVYGDARVFPTPEAYWGNVNPVGPRSCYDEGKRFGEALCKAHERAYGLDTRIVRIFNTYGARLRADGLYARALSRFIVQALANQNLTIYGRGNQTRSFCYVTDTARAILLASIREKMKSQVVNIGSPKEITILSLAEKIIEIVGSKSKVTHLQRPVDDPQRRCPDISRAKALLNWTPEVALEEGLSKTIRWFTSNRA